MVISEVNKIARNFCCFWRFKFFEHGFSLTVVSTEFSIVGVIGGVFLMVPDSGIVLIRELLVLFDLN